jgi:aconitate hydratase
MQRTRNGSNPGAGRPLAVKILESHMVSGRPIAGEEIAITIDQTLTQDATGTMACLQFEAMGIPQVRTKLSVSYVDHNTLQTGFENADDHRFLQTVAAKYGVYYSRPGNGICHQVHLERFAAPGQTLLGSDSHTPTAGGLGMIAIGAGGLDVAVAMGGGPFYLTMPKITLVSLTGKLGPWVTAKDVILEMLRRLTVKGGVGKIIEYGGPGVEGLTAPERATITNMGAELGATTSVFPSDITTKAFLKAQRRETAWMECSADPDAAYDEVIEIDLGELEPLIAQPHMPDNVSPVKEVEGTKVSQVAIGSCTNSSFRDMMTVAGMLRGKKVHPEVSLAVSPGSRQVLETISRNGALADIISAGARILEVACGPCIGMGQSPASDGVSIRTFNRNFKGRSGTASGRVYLSSPEVAVACALRGVISDPRTLGDPIKVEMPHEFLVDDSMIIPPSKEPKGVQIIRGPNIKPLPVNDALPDTIKAEVLLKTPDNITTDDIMPAGAKILPLRSNIPALAEHVYEGVDSTFAARANAADAGFILGGENYGQGSSREHAALAPMYLGIKAVVAKGFARIHRANLINFGILPLTFVNPADYDATDQGDVLEMSGLRDAVKSGQLLTVKNVTKGSEFPVDPNPSERQAEILLAGGLLNYTKKAQSLP